MPTAIFTAKATSGSAGRGGAACQCRHYHHRARRAHLKEVTVEARNGVSAWVKEGLAVGAQVIVYPDSKLKDQQKVNPR